jgi:phage tail-like protein
MTTYTHRLKISGPAGDSVFEIPAGTTTIGRQEGNGLILDHPLVSRRHARLDCKLELCTLVDLASSNGTRVDGELIHPNAPIPLSSPSEIRIGPFEMRYESVPVPAPRTEEPVIQEVTREPDFLPDEVGSPQIVPADQSAVGDGSGNGDGSGGSEAGEPVAPVTPPPVLPISRNGAGADDGLVPPGLAIHSQRLIQYLPGIYDTDFMRRFLGIFESILLPVEWNIANFDLFLSPETAPAGFLPWLEGWFGLTFDSSWSEAQRRTITREATKIFARRGTRWALSRVLEIYTGIKPEIVDDDPKLEPFTFRVRIHKKVPEAERQAIARLIDAHKPIYTTYTLLFEE